MTDMRGCPLGVFEGSGFMPKALLWPSSLPPPFCSLPTTEYTGVNKVTLCTNLRGPFQPWQDPYLSCRRSEVRQADLEEVADVMSVKS